MASPINPNLHVILIHYPLAMLIVGTMIELFAFLWRNSSFRTAGRWMILLGALSAVPATFSGIYALSDVAHHNNAVTDGSWADMKAGSPILSQPKIWSTLWNHMLYQSIATTLCVFVVVFWLGCSDRFRKTLHYPLLVLLLIGVGIIIRGAYHGGESVYTDAVGVGLHPPGESAPSDPPTFAFEKYISIVEVHVIAAGAAFALAMVTIGLSFRKITSIRQFTETRPIVPQPETYAERSQRAASGTTAMARTFNPDIELLVQPFTPAARFWLLTCFVALMTMLGGWFLLASDSSAFARAKETHQPIYKLLWQQVKPEPPAKINRQFAHVITGAVIVVFPLLLAGMARFMPRRKWWLILFTFILTAAVAAQIWFGILLLLDSSQGLVNHFLPNEASTSTKPATGS